MMAIIKQFEIIILQRGKLFTGLGFTGSGNPITVHCSEKKQELLYNWGLQASPNMSKLRKLHLKKDGMFGESLFSANKHGSMAQVCNIASKQTA